jgi:hypothetical protein
MLECDVNMLWVWWIICLLAVFFWAWAFVDMLMRRKVKTGNKILLSISFLVFNMITAIVWWIYKLNKYRW